MQLLSPASPGTSLLCLFSNFTQRPRLYGGAKMEESWDGEWGGGDSLARVTWGWKGNWAKHICGERYPALGRFSIFFKLLLAEILKNRSNALE